MGSKCSFNVLSNVYSVGSGPFALGRLCWSKLELRTRVNMAAQTRALVSVQWLADAIKNKLAGPKLRILDTSWYLPNTKRVTRDEFAQKHIPGASFFDIDECSDSTSPYDHMLPTSSHFSKYVGDLGIGNDTHVVVYDTSDFGAYSAPRVWWMFRAFGHGLVSVLDGGMKNWVAEGHPVTSEYNKPERQDFRATLNVSWVKSFEDVMENIRTKEVQVVDTRIPGRFNGIEPEPREGLKKTECSPEKGGAETTVEGDMKTSSGTGRNEEDALLHDTIQAATWNRTQSFQGRYSLPDVVKMDEGQQ
ncbi:thiosulfate sulfurtransferase isoform X3 [Oryzias latipes]|uniref:thiosulfate sulfurtransferase isoform X3 n=1 Tax=Oryzias latipes TaxID=8090 RepID=UPI000CE18A5F|nr:thiosulfate sulfurtransferase isoform X3 [Oryzias latipes]